MINWIQEFMKMRIKVIILCGIKIFLKKLTIMKNWRMYLNKIMLLINFK